MKRNGHNQALMLYERNKAGHKQAFETFEFETIESQSNWLSWKNHKGGHKQALLDEKVTEKVTINSLSLQTLKNRSQSSTIG